MSSSMNSSSWADSRIYIPVAMENSQKTPIKINKIGAISKLRILAK